MTDEQLRAVVLGAQATRVWHCLAVFTACAVGAAYWTKVGSWGGALVMAFCLGWTTSRLLPAWALLRYMEKNPFPGKGQSGL